jgi:uncharacterized protein (TIGR02266 family)
MPEMNGLDCCRVIKSIADSAAIPVVMITARGDETSMANCRAAGCDGFLTKPLDRKQFLDTASRFLAGIERRERRMPVNVPAAFNSRGTTFSCMLSDLSLGGVFIRTDFSCEIDRVIQLDFALPNGIPVRCQGRITWFRKSGNGSPLGFGVNFVLLPKETKDAVSNFIATAA